jgi:hypothetical protein
MFVLNLGETCCARVEIAVIKDRTDEQLMRLYTITAV